MTFGPTFALTLAPTSTNPPLNLQPLALTLPPPLARAQVGEAYFQPAAAKLAREGDLLLACIDHPFTSGEDPVATWLETERVGGTSPSDMHRSCQPPEALAPMSHVASSCPWLSLAL